jgi:hypothetical protein
MEKPVSQFWEKYKHPNWQRKRLVIMKRAGFACEQCDSTEATLNVHHSYYERGLDPWEYPNESLHCLCDKCHKESDEIRKRLNRQIGRLQLRQIEELLGFARGLELEDCLPSVNHTADNYDVLCGMMRVFSTLNRRELDRYISCVVSILGDDRTVNSDILFSAAEEVRLIDQVLEGQVANAEA